MFGEIRHFNGLCTEDVLHADGKPVTVLFDGKTTVECEKSTVDGKGRDEEASVDSIANQEGIREQ